MAAVDQFASMLDGKDSPPSNAAAVTTSDTVDLAFATRALIVGTAGNIAVITLGGQTVTIPVPAGFIWLRVTRVKATGTTATGITALW